MAHDVSCFVSPSSIISTPMLWESLFSLLPSKVLVNHTITRAYSTSCDGWSLQSMYKGCGRALSKKQSGSLPVYSTKPSDSPTPVLVLMSVVLSKPNDETHVATPYQAELKVEIPASPVHTGSYDSLSQGTTWPAVSLAPKPLRRTIIGAFLSVVPSSASVSDASFVGSPDAFVFTLQPEVSVYRLRTKQHSSFLYSSANELRVGLGEKGSAIVLQSDLHSGITSTCASFNSPPLVNVDENTTGSTTASFQVLQCEVLMFKAK